MMHLPDGPASIHFLKFRYAEYHRGDDSSTSRYININNNIRDLEQLFIKRLN